MELITQKDYAKAVKNPSTLLHQLVASKPSEATRLKKAASSLKIPMDRVIELVIKRKIPRGVRISEDEIYFLSDNELRKYLINPNTVTIIEDSITVHRDWYYKGIGGSLRFLPKGEKYEVAIDGIEIPKEGFDCLKGKMGRKNRISDEEMKKIFLDVKKDWAPAECGYDKYFAKVLSRCVKEHNISYSLSTLKRKYLGMKL